MNEEEEIDWPTFLSTTADSASKKEDTNTDKQIERERKKNTLNLHKQIES